MSPEGNRTDVAELREYVAMTLAYVGAADTSDEALKRATDESWRIQNRLWDIALSHRADALNSDMGSAYLDSLMETSTQRQTRMVIALSTRIQLPIWLILLFLVVLGMVSVGYQTGIAGSKRPLAQPIMALSFALVIALITDLDRPNSGLLEVPQVSHTRLLTRMDMEFPAGEPSATEAEVDAEPSME